MFYIKGLQMNTKISEALKNDLLTMGSKSGDPIQSVNTNIQSGLEIYQEKILELLNNSISKNTRKALISDTTQYLLWFDKTMNDTVVSKIPFPMNTDVLSAYIAHMVSSDKSRSTILRNVSSISTIHEMQNLENPTKTEVIRRLLKGLKRTTDGRQKKAKALHIKELLRILDKLGSSWIERRNAAILSVGYLGALRCSEIAGLDLSDIGEEESDGITVFIAKSKTDQEMKGALLALPYSKITEQVLYWKTRLLTLYKIGPLFPRFGSRDKWFPKPGERDGLTERSISLIIKDCVKLIGLNPDEYSPHSLRSGFCTDASKYGVPEHIIQRHSRHASISVLRGYVQEGNKWEENPLQPIFESVFSPGQNK